MSSIVRSTFSIVFCVFIVLLVSTLLPLPTEAIYFHIIEGQPKCFIEEVPADTLVVATYKNPDFIEFGKPEFTGVVSNDGFVPICLRVWVVSVKLFE